MLVTVAEDAGHRPLFVTYLGEELRVNSIDQWWEHRPVDRIYYRVTLEDGARLEVFKNMNHGGWYFEGRQREKGTN